MIGWKQVKDESPPIHPGNMSGRDAVENMMRRQRMRDG